MFAFYLSSQSAFLFQDKVHEINDYEEERLIWAPWWKDVLSSYQPRRSVCVWVLSKDTLPYSEIHTCYHTPAVQGSLVLVDEQQNFLVDITCLISFQDFQGRVASSCLSPLFGLSVCSPKTVGGLLFSLFPGLQSLSPHCSLFLMPLYPGLPLPWLCKTEPRL